MEKLKPESRGFETSRDLAVRRPSANWIDALEHFSIFFCRRMHQTLSQSHQGEKISWCAKCNAGREIRWRGKLSSTVCLIDHTHGYVSFAVVMSYIVTDQLTHIPKLLQIGTGAFMWQPNASSATENGAWPISSHLLIMHHLKDCCISDGNRHPTGMQINPQYNAYSRVNKWLPRLKLQSLQKQITLQAGILVVVIFNLPIISGIICFQLFWLSSSAAS